MMVSAIIPTRNRCQALERTLESLAGMDDSERDFEIIVVDNGSTDATPEVYDAVRAKHSTRQFRYFHEPMPGLLSGRHRGAREAAGELCAFLDDDVRVSAGWLGAVREAFQRPQVVLAGGPSLPLFATVPPVWIDSFWVSDERGKLCTWLSLFDGGSVVKEIDPLYILGLNFTIRRGTLFALGGFHPDCMPPALQRFQGDGETGLSLKIRSAGWKALYHPRIAVHHEVAASRMTPRYFEQRAYYQGVCDSYSQIRSRGTATGRKGSWRTKLQEFKRILSGVDCIECSEADRIWHLTEHAYGAGYDFHQHAVGSDPVLLQWVLRKDYFDYGLPAGWERFVESKGCGPK